MITIHHEKKNFFSTDYSCALQREILVHGRLYVSQNYLCFYANIFTWETHLIIRWKDVTSMTKEKTALVIPNAISVVTASERFLFTSFGSRDKTHMMLFKIWQNVLMGQVRSMLPFISSFFKFFSSSYYFITSKLTC